ncbi:hypothetical protein BCV69DRAFT_301172 [Microstroma glucosiphilum]|uniref:Cation-transporting ATPase n=1 Tax=Pseudomicrostroma glucosiphilum TaxID=1684307 RepID=A0A316U1J6_9BASI|nr:hypothetical protein BCV69DRAFT_301172 [Pseudomicrostroma glucosiphilum]PWN18361.1 hypothetical protein BCV69DRAFT_301172 [Pseudomicrostroma glucosiphilum]
MASSQQPVPSAATTSAPSQQAPTQAFTFVEGDDPELLAWEAAQATASGKGKALNRFARDYPLGANSRTTSIREGNSTLAASGHLVPGVTRDAPLQESYLEKKERKSSSSQDEKEKILSIPSHVAVQLDSLPDVSAERDNKGTRSVYLPVQFHMQINLVRRKTFSFILYIIGSIFSLGFLALIAGYWSPALYIKWIYETTDPPSPQDLAGNKKKQSLHAEYAPTFHYAERRCPWLPQDAQSCRRAGAHLQPSHPQLPTYSTGVACSLLGMGPPYGVEGRGLYHLGAKAVGQAEVNFRRSLFGLNIIDVKGRSLVSLTIGEALHPFYLFSFIACDLWFYDTYQGYAAVIIVLSVLGIFATVF